MATLALTLYSTGGVAVASHEVCREYERRRPGVVVRHFNEKEAALIPRIAEGREGDLVSIGAEFPIDAMQVEGLVDREHRYHIGRRDVALLVPAGNPKRILAFDDLLRDGVRVGANWDGCLAGTWESVALAARPDAIDVFRRRIAALGDGCARLTRHLLEGDVDVILGWSSFPSFKAEAIECVRLPEPQRIYRSTSVALLTCSAHPGAALDLATFMAGPDGRAIYRRLGWETP